MRSPEGPRNDNASVLATTAGMASDCPASLFSLIAPTNWNEADSRMVCGLFPADSAPGSRRGETRSPIYSQRQPDLVQAVCILMHASGLAQRFAYDVIRCHARYWVSLCRTVGLASRLRYSRDFSIWPRPFHRWKSGLDVDNMAENLIIQIGQATPSGSGPGVAVPGQFVSSGDTFAFTSRFGALVERNRYSVAQPNVFVTTLPQTRRDYRIASRTTGAAAWVRVCHGTFSFPFTLNQSGATSVVLS